MHNESKLNRACIFLYFTPEKRTTPYQKNTIHIRNRGLLKRNFPAQFSQIIQI